MNWQTSNPPESFKSSRALKRFTVKTVFFYQEVTNSPLTVNSWSSSATALVNLSWSGARGRPAQHITLAFWFITTLYHRTPDLNLGLL